jgi:hypothetical protein
MLKSKIEGEASLGAPGLTPDLLSNLKRQDMKQAIVERFAANDKIETARTAVRSGARSPYWQSADEEC